MNGGDFSIDPRRCFVHGLTRVQHFSTPMSSDTTSCGVSWWECPQCNHATAVFNINAPAAVAPPSAPPFDPEFNCPTHFAKGDPTCAACIAKQPAFGPPEITAPTATDMTVALAVHEIVEFFEELEGYDWECVYDATNRIMRAVYGAVSPLASPATPTPSATHGFHQRDGWYFKRLANGAVRIRKTMSSHPASAVEVEHIIPADEWVSVVAHLSAFTDGAVAYGAASELHYGPQ